MAVMKRMTKSPRMTNSQRRDAYREAVRATLVRFYDTPDPLASEVVEAWWQRLSAMPDVFGSGAFMHREPMNTAANIVGKPVIPIIPEVWPAYEQLLNSARDRVLGWQPPPEMPALPVNVATASARLPTPTPARDEARESMDIRTASDYLGVSPDTLHKYASEGFVPAFKLGNRWRFKRSRLDEWMDDSNKKKIRRNKVDEAPKNLAAPPPKKRLTGGA
jgi:excisionase family DNA binding protein